MKTSKGADRETLFGGAQHNTGITQETNMKTKAFSNCRQRRRCVLSMFSS